MIPAEAVEAYNPDCFAGHDYTPRFKTEDGQCCCYYCGKPEPRVAQVIPVEAG